MPSYLNKCVLLSFYCKIKWKWWFICHESLITRILQISRWHQIQLTKIIKWFLPLCYYACLFFTSIHKINLIFKYDIIFSKKRGEGSFFVTEYWEVIWKIKYSYYKVKRKIILPFCQYFLIFAIYDHTHIKTIHKIV